MTEQTAAVILSHNRPWQLTECVESIRRQVDVVLVIDNASEPPAADFGGNTVTVHVPDQPPNLAVLWNGALDRLGIAMPGLRWVAFLCDDTTVPDGWVREVTKAMDETGAAAGCSNPWGHDHPPRLKTEPDGDIMGRMVGWAFILDTSKGLRADESMHWWWVDGDVDWQARLTGGMVMIGGYPVPNHQPGAWTNAKPELGEQAGRDRAAFAAKWGYNPW